jgi:LPXTG-motif cell wall-anchored protein
VPATLTEEGVELFRTDPESQPFYPAGTVLDPVTITLNVDDPGELPPPTTPTTASVGCLDKSSVAVGAAINACGSGFQAGEQVQVYVHSTPVFVKVLTADASGAVTTSVTIPAGTAAGKHRIELRGVTSGRSIFSSEFTVTAAGGSGLPKTGSQTGNLVLAALLVLGVGMILSGRSMVRTNRAR